MKPMWEPWRVAVGQMPDSASHLICRIASEGFPAQPHLVSSSVKCSGEKSAISSVLK